MRRHAFKIYGMKQRATHLIYIKDQHRGTDVAIVNSEAVAEATFRYDAVAAFDTQ